MARLTDVLDDAMKSPIGVEGNEWLRIMLARLIVFVSICLGWLVILGGMLVWSAVHTS